MCLYIMMKSASFQKILQTKLTKEIKLEPPLSAADKKRFFILEEQHKNLQPLFCPDDPCPEENKSEIKYKDEISKVEISKKRRVHDNSLVVTIAFE